MCSDYSKKNTEKFIVTELVKESHAFMVVYQHTDYCVCKISPLDVILSQSNPVHISETHLRPIFYHPTYK
jgi:hypothetical protein